MINFEELFKNNPSIEHIAGTYSYVRLDMGPRKASHFILRVLEGASGTERLHICTPSFASKRALVRFLDEEPIKEIKHWTALEMLEQE